MSTHFEFGATAGARGVFTNEFSLLSAMNESKLVLKLDKLIKYSFPPSPLPDETDDSADTMATSTITLPSMPGLRDDPVHLPTPESTPTKDHERLSYHRTSDSPHSIQLIPDATETQSRFANKKKIIKGCEKENDVECCTLGSKFLTDCLADGRVSSLQCDSPKPAHPKQTKGTVQSEGKGKQRMKKVAKPKKSSAALNREIPPASCKSKPTSAKATGNNHLLTEYFPVRRSARRTTTDLKKQHQDELEQAILSHSTDGLKVKPIVGKGRGVVATKVFRRGDFVIEYDGDLISHAAAKEREKKYSANPEYGCYMYYFSHNNKNYCIDATAESGKLGRLLNHSCKVNNCATKVVPIGGKPYLILVASRDIQADEELLYDYGDRSKESLEAHPWLAL